MKKSLVRGAVIACGVVVWGCNGWPPTNDARQAEQQPEKYPTYAAAGAAQTPTIVFENRRYVVTPAPVDLHEAQLQSVGAAGSVSIYAPRGAQPPYSILYTPVSGSTWRRVVPIE
ncbi:MAG TPA: hypothetical protein VF021_05150 [Longimicrobiales bacterium]